MAHNADLLVSALTHLEPKVAETFMQGIPTFSYIIGKQTGEGASGGKLNKFKLEGPYLEFIVQKNGPGQGITLEQGDESIHGSRRQGTARGNEFTGYMMYYYNVPGIDFAESGGKQDIGKIIDNYPMVAIDDMKQAFNRQLVAGKAFAGTDPVTNGFTGLATLNGNQGYRPKGENRTGLLVPAARASQTGTTHNLPRDAAASNPTTGWYNQFDTISSFAVDGMRKYRTMVQTANQQGLSLDGSGVDLVCCDLGTFQNMLEEMGDMIIEIDKANYPLAKYLNRDGFKVGNVDWYWDPDIDLTDTTAFNATQQTGLAYVLNTSKFHLFYQAGHASMTGTGLFDMGEPIPLPDQDGFQFRIKTNLNFYCESLRHQGVLVGGAQE